MRSIKTLKQTAKLSLVILFATYLLFSCSEEKFRENRNMTVLFYNVENLFDTEDEPGEQDEEFTPDGEKNWTVERYNEKIENITRVIASVNQPELPEIVGLCEVENKKVLTDLIETERLSDGNYRIVQYDSPDPRGIDCALIYRPDEFTVLAHHPITIFFENEPDYKTRDILYVKGKANNGEELHVFVNHWPSRIGGTQATEPSRVEVASILKNKIDSLYQIDAGVKIIVMGDMNDEPDNNSLETILGAKMPGTNSARLVNLMYPADSSGEGSYKYQGNWNMLDNLVVSKSLLDDEGFRVEDSRGHVSHEPWMEYINNDGEISPDRTYGGPNYYGGPSDHFPAYFSLTR